MKFFIQDIREGLDLAYTLDKDQTDELMTITQGDISGADDGVTIQGRAMRVDETVLIHGKVTAHLSFQCGRCLTTRTLRTDVDLDAALIPEPGPQANQPKDLQLNAEEMGVSFYKDDEVDLHEVVREAILLELPAFPSCEDVGETCSLPDAVSKHVEAKHERHDPRWDALRALRDKMNDRSE